MEIQQECKVLLGHNSEKKSRQTTAELKQARQSMSNSHCHLTVNSLIIPLVGSQALSSTLNMFKISMRVDEGSTHFLSDSS